MKNSADYAKAWSVANTIWNLTVEGYAVALQKHISKHSMQIVANTRHASHNLHQSAIHQIEAKPQRKYWLHRNSLLCSWQAKQKNLREDSTNKLWVVSISLQL